MGDYHDYVIQGDRLIGRFEEMYQDCPNPWPETRADYEANMGTLRTKQIISAGPYKNILSVGSGTGQHLAWLKEGGRAAFRGLEVSPTARAKSLERYPDIPVDEGKVLPCLQETALPFDLFLFREVVWYILPQWAEVCKTLARRFAGKHIIVDLSFYSDQEYGLDHFNGPDEFVEKFPFKVLEVVRHHSRRDQRQGMAMVFGEIGEKRD